jgi:hypothetical protein
MKKVLIAMLAVLILSNVAFAGSIEDFINDGRWCNGTWWPSGQMPKNSNWTAWGCCAYVADYVRYCYGETWPSSGSQFWGAGNIRRGDVLYFKPDHWVVVVYRSGNSLYTAEGNWNDRVTIGWNYTIVGNQLYRNGRQFRTFNCGYHH